MLLTVTHPVSTFDSAVLTPVESKYFLLFSDSDLSASFCDGLIVGHS